MSKGHVFGAAFVRRREKRRAGIGHSAVSVSVNGILKTAMSN